MKSGQSLKLWIYTACVCVALTAALSAREEAKIAVIEKADGNSIELIAVQLPLVHKVDGADVSKHQELYLVNRSGRTLLWKRGVGLASGRDSIKSNLCYTGLKDALISPEKIEVVANGCLDNYVFKRFLKKPEGWKFDGEVNLWQTQLADEKVSLTDWGTVQINYPISGKVMVFNIDSEGVARINGKPYIPKKTLLGGTDGPEIAYKSMYQLRAEEYNLPRDANGMTIWEDPVKPSTPSTIKVPSSETQKATKAKVDNASSDSKTSTAPAAAPQTSNLMLFIAGGVILVGIVVLISEIKNKRKKP
jgi:hypothetical protein